MRETYCRECGEWSPNEEWTEGDVYDDGQIVESYVACPSCCYHHPLHDPPTRKLMPMDKRTARRIIRASFALGAVHELHGLDELILARNLVENARFTQEQGLSGREKAPGITAAILAIYEARPQRRRYSEVRG